MNYKEIQWSNVITLVPASELENITACFLAKVEVSITPETLYGHYSDRTNQLKLELEPEYPVDIVVDDKGTSLPGTEYLFKCVSTPDKSFDLLLLVDGNLNNIGYVVLSEAQNVGLAKNYYIKMILVITENIVEASINTALGKVKTYSPIQDDREFKWKYRGVSKGYIESRTTTKLQRLLGGFGEYNSQNELSLFDLPKRVELPNEENLVTNLVRLITINDIVFVYEVYTINGNKAIRRYQFNQDNPDIEVLLENVTLGDFIIPYINGCLSTSGSVTKLVYYKEFGSISKEDNGFGFRVYNNHVFPNYANQLVSSDEEGILESSFNEWKYYNIFNISNDLIVYALRNSPNSILTQHNSFENNSIIKLPVSGIPKYSLIEKVGLNDYVIKSNNIFKVLRILSDNYQDITSTNFLDENKLGRIDFRSENKSNADRIVNIVPFKGCYYYFKIVGNKHYLYLV